MIKLPTTRKENIQFGLIMCFGMVLVMSIYNLYINGIIGEITFIEGISDFAIGFVIAFILTANTNKKIYTVLAISICMVLGMAFLMSIYGLVSTYIHIGYTSNSMIIDYLSIFGKNLIIALPLQIIVMGPLVRYIFTRYIQVNRITMEN